MLSNWVIEDFGEAIIQRGKALHAQKRFLIGSTRPGKIGHVNGSVWDGRLKHRVRVSWNSSTIEWHCDCRNFIALDRCEHVVALLMEAGDRGMLPPDMVQKTAEAAPAREQTEGAVYRTPGWPAQLAHLRELSKANQSRPAISKSPDPNREILYILESPPRPGEPTSIRVLSRTRDPEGDWRAPERLDWSLSRLSEIPVADRPIVTLLAGVGNGSTVLAESYPVSPAMVTQVLPLISRTGRLFRREGGQAELRRVIWQETPFDLAISIAPMGDDLAVRCIVLSDEQSIECHSPRLRRLGNLLALDGSIGRFREGLSGLWLERFALLPPIMVAASSLWEMLKELSTLANLPPLRIDESLQITQVVGDPSIHVRLEPGGRWDQGDAVLAAQVSYGYGDNQPIPASSSDSFAVKEDLRQIIMRNRPAESAAVELMGRLGFRTDGPLPMINVRNVMPAAIAMISRGWKVEGQGVGRCRAGASLSVDVHSGTDWFDVAGQAAFGEEQVPLANVLEAIRKGERSVILPSGATGVLPISWLKPLRTLAGTGQEMGDALRFGTSQVAILDALLQEVPEAKFDAEFAARRERLKEFEGIKPASAPRSFKGKLRDYQKAGLGWFAFLREFGFGGCLADDMGLGKTVQVLALLEQQRLAKRKATEDTPRPSLVVAPRSLIFNWMQEAARFTPQLKILNHTGAGRADLLEQIPQHDLVLTTYGTLRLDAPVLQKITFNYLILDESQAIKNATTATSRSARLLSARYRLALSGTPIENHLGELWSLFDFLNPGMLGPGTLFRKSNVDQRVSAQTAQLLSKALRPYILRRTKSQVARELPERTEQTIFCELKPNQRREYDQLKEQYRQILLGSGPLDLGRNRMQVLEGLLRLRQAACHPGLLNEHRRGEESAKLNAILEQVRETVEEGHKAIVFSQFTSFLGILRTRLDSEGIAYEYLDGQTEDRQAHVERFQTDKNCQLFLISLKAGGVGLNLTAAEYVFLLDPWWNPAVEAQAIDRAHRIGQTRHVFAYRLIARDTVEEKVLALQDRKRDLADAIITASTGPLASLTREDLELLLA